MAVLKDIVDWCVNQQTNVTQPIKIKGIGGKIGGDIT
jgi:hypothetical protein